jgi:hypothetical protein
VSVSLSRRKFEHIQELSARNDDLQKLLMASDELSISRARRKTTPWVTVLRTFQDQARSLYATMEKCWLCDCAGAHDAGLFLEARAIGTLDENVALNLIIGSPKKRRTLQVKACKDTTLQPPPGDCFPSEQKLLADLKNLVLSDSTGHLNVTSTAGKASQTKTAFRGISSLSNKNTS